MQISPCSSARATLVFTTLLLPVVLGLAGCGHTQGEFVTITPPPVDTPPPPAAKARFGYVANAHGNVISMYTISTTGAWQLNTPALAMAGISPEALVIDPQGKFVYATSLDQNVSMFAIDQTTGLLIPLSPARIPTGGAYPQDIAMAPSGNYAYTADTNGGDVTVFAVNKTNGQLTQVATVPVVSAFSSQGTSDPIAVTVHPSGKFLYVTNGVYEQAYAIDPNTGIPTFLPPANAAQVYAGVRPFKFAIDPTGMYGYVPDNGGNNVYEFSINQTTGQLQPLAPNFVVSGNQPAWVAFGTLYPYAYVSNRLGSTITSFQTNATTGQLTAAGSTSGVDFPWPMLFDPSGQILYVLDEDSDKITSFATHADGSLTQIATYLTGFVPASFAVTE